MDLQHPRCAGLDVHKDTVVASVRIASGRAATHEVRTFGTTTRELLGLVDWLTAHEVTHVAMEATGVYWKPVWHILESHFELVLGNAMHIKNVPGRKSDVNDATWISDLLAHGLISGSFVPPEPIQDLRQLTRTRKQLTKEIGQHTMRIQKTLEDANIKLSSVITDTVGGTGRAILDALIAGETDPVRLAALAQGSVVRKRDALIEALHGRVTSTHRILLKTHLGQIRTLEDAIRELEGEMATLIEPFRAKIRRLTSIPGVKETAALVIAAEIGFDMSHFPTAAHLISWACLCPRMDESAGKKKSTRVRRGANWLKPLLVQAAWAAARKKDGYLRAQFLRIKSRRGPKKAILAVAASILTAVYYILRDDVDYRDLGADYFDRQNKERVALRLARRIQELGYQVEMRPAA
ncbi:MAG: IS110 family transposase [Elusimicrobia bacterium]|nr:IS110 family transposase [Cyanobacteria bacterium REEB65]MDE2040686.1 IS110 family transposase [Elusimicrobiota bacterium]